MNFNWDIDVWAVNETAEEVRKEPWLSYLRAVLKPVKVLYAQFLTYRGDTLKKMRYNSQQIVLQNLLNDMFDNTQRRITVTTIYDILKPPYVAQQSENQPLYVSTQAETDLDDDLIVYISQQSELGVNYDFIVECADGSLTANQEIRLKAIVNYYRLASKKPLFIYDNNQIF